MTWEQRGMQGVPKFTVSQALPDVDYAAFARSLGLIGINISTVDELTAGWDRALAADRPVLLDVICDPSVPPVPPHATFEQAKALGSAVLHGDDDAWDVVRQGLKQKAQRYLPGMPGHKD